MQRIRAVMLAGVMLALVLATGVKAQVLNLVPSDSWAVIKISNLQRTSDKVAKFAQDIGVDEMVEQLANPVGALQEESGIKQGVDLSGDLAVAIPDFTTLEDSDKPRILILVPVSDYDAFLKNFTDAKVEDGIAQVTMPKGGEDEPGFIAHWDNYAAISPIRDIVAKRPAGLTLGGAAKAQFDQQDAVVYFNLPAMRERALPELKAKRAELVQKMLSEYDKGGENNPESAKFRPVVEVVANQLLNGAEHVLESAQAVTIGLSIGDKGISSTSIAEFVPDSYVGKLVTAYQVKDEQLLAGLPAFNYMLMGGVTLDPTVVSQLVSDTLAPIIDAANQLQDSAGPVLAKYLQAQQALYASVTGMSAGVLVPTAMPGQGALIQSVGVIHGDIPKVLDAQRQITELQGQLMTDAANTGITPEFKYTENAKTVEGVSLSHFVFSFKVDPEKAGPEAQQMQMMMTMIGGPSGMGGYSGQVANDRGFFELNLTDEQLTQAVQAAKSGANAVEASPAVQETSSQLPAGRIAVGYLNLGQLASSAANYAKMFGMPINVKLPPNLPPIGGVIAKEGSTLRADSFIPTSLVQSLVAAGMQTMTAMQGGQ